MSSKRRIRREQSIVAMQLEGERIDCLLKRSSARRSLNLRVNARGMAQVNAPWAMPMAHIEDFVRRHRNWLRGQLARQRDKSAWTDVPALPFLGGELRLERRMPMPNGTVRQEGGCLVCEVDEANLAPAVVGWYRTQAERHLADRLRRICYRLAQPPPPWRLSDARTRWGSLSARGVVGLNWRLVKAGPDEIDYVICHELAHFKRRDHSPAFWREVAAICPEYREIRRHLKSNGARYMAF